MKPKLLTGRKLNEFRGKNLVGALSKEEIFMLFAHFDFIEMWLDDKDEDGTFGTESWRPNIGLPD